MKIRTTLALTAAALALAVPVAAAEPDGFQPQLRANAQPDAVDRYLANNGPDGFQPQLRAGGQPDAVDRYVANALRGAERLNATARSLNNGAGPDVPVNQAQRGGLSWSTAALGALGGGLIVLLAVVGASTMRERRRFVLR